MINELENLKIKTKNLIESNDNLNNSNQKKTNQIEQLVGKIEQIEKNFDLQINETKQNFNEKLRDYEMQISKILPQNFIIIFLYDLKFTHRIVINEINNFFFEMKYNIKFKFKIVYYKRMS